MSGPGIEVGVLIGALWLGSTAFAGQEVLAQPSEGASGFVSSPSKEPDVSAYPSHRLMTLVAIRAYQLVISPSKGSVCPMHPHCSLYGYRAFQAYDLPKAFVVTADRLHRCGHDLDMYEAAEVDGMVKFFDPVDPREMDRGLEEASNDAAAPRIGVASTTSPPGRDERPQAFLESDTLLFKFAGSLRDGGSYDQAIIEYRRLTNYFPGSAFVDSSMFSVLECYYQSGQYLTAADWGRGLIEAGLCQRTAGDLRFVIGKSYLRLENFALARDYFSQGAKTANNEIVAEKSEMLRGLAYAYEGDWRESERVFLAAKSGTRFSQAASGCALVAQDAQKLKRKSPVVAGFLSVVPGLGYLYSGYKQTALSSFIVNGLFIWGTTEAFRNDNESLGAMLGVLSFGWYTGNIYGSVVSAERRNIDLKRRMLLRLDVGFSF